jgi:hypothetical protein
LSIVRNSFQKALEKDKKGEIVNKRKRDTEKENPEQENLRCGIQVRIQSVRPPDP